MALAKKCDICGRFYDYDYKIQCGINVDKSYTANGICIINSDEGNYAFHREHLDLCEPCMTTVIGLLREMKERKK